MAIITTIINQKGGTGKTTTAVNLGGALASLGRSVVLIDIDPHASLTYSFGISDADGTIEDVFRGSRELKDILIEKEGMLIAPASTDLANIELSLINTPGRENYLSDTLRNTNEAEYIFIDSPPSLSILTINALKAADQLLVPMQMEVLSLHGLINLFSTIEEFRDAFNAPLPIKGIVAVMYHSRAKLDGEVLACIRENINERLFQAKIRSDVRIAESPSFAKSVIRYAPSSRGAKDYMELAKEFINTK